VKLYHKRVLFLFYCLILVLTVYSFVLIDPNLTLINHNLWAQIKEFFINFGYLQREKSSRLYLSLVALLFIFYLYFVKHYKKINIVSLIVPLSFLAIFSYPFLSHDFFNYIFDAKILTYYHKNPYFFKAVDFPQDLWPRFMHWTHRTYPYGPVFLVLSVIPSFFSLGKFILNFLFFKAFFCVFYILATYCLYKMNKRYAIVFAANPLIIIEGLVASHNDLIAVCLAIIGIYYLYRKKDKISRFFLLASSGIKYITLPLLFLSRQRNKFGNKINLVVFLGQLAVLFYLCWQLEIQPWYFLSLFALIPFYEKLIINLNIFFAGLLFAYYPFVRYGDWVNESIKMKHNIIVVFFIINLGFVIGRELLRHQKIG